MAASNHSPSCPVTALRFQLEPQTQQQPPEMVIPKNSSSFFLVDKHELIPQSCSEQLGEKDRLDLPKTLKISSFEVLHLFLGAFPPSLSAGLLSSLPQLCSQGIAVQVSVVPPWQEEEELLPAASSPALQHRENVYYLLKLCLRSESPALLPLPLILITARFLRRLIILLGFQHLV